MAFLDKEVKTKIKLDLWNDAINIILKYSMAAIDKTQHLDEEMPKFSSKCLRAIIMGKYDDGNNENKISNYNDRKNSNVPTIHSQLIRDNICDIYRWKTSLSPAYINNIEKCDNVINTWEIMWGGGCENTG